MRAGIRHLFRTFSRSVALLAVGVALASAPSAQAQQPGPGPGFDPDPVIFLHGFSGSGAQFETQATRFVGQGYAPEIIRSVEYNSLNTQMIMPMIFAQIDAAVADLQAISGHDQVNLVGHSLGTALSQTYLNSSPARAANIANYVNIDGQVATALPGGVRTLALFAGAARAVQGQIVGATNVTLPDQEHVQAVTSVESFAQMFQFFNGVAPTTTQVIPANGPISISGRALLFPQNDVVEPGSIVMVFPLDPATGQRARTMMGMFAMPVAMSDIAADGSFGGITTTPGLPHEFLLLRPTQGDNSFFTEPLLASSNMFRLLTGEMNVGLDTLITRDPATQAIIFVRNQEFRGDRDAGVNDVLSLDGTNVINAVSAPSGFVGSPVAMVVQDVRADGVTNLAMQAPGFDNVPFISGVDAFSPSSPVFLPLRLDIVQRGNAANARTLMLPRIASSRRAATVFLRDFDQ